MISSRTKLLRVKPADPEGANRESFASLLVRTASANDVSPAILLERAFSDEDKLRTLRFSSRTVGQSLGQTLNGSSHVTQQIVTRAEELTQLAGLNASTTLAFAPFSTVNGLLRPKLAWSPRFLRDSTTEYYPLLWALDAVRVDPTTREPLVCTCPSCRQTLNVLSGGTRIGVCYRCGSRLAAKGAAGRMKDPLSATIRNLDYELWIAEQLGAYIAFQCREPLPDDFDCNRTVQFWIDQFGLKVDAKTAAQLGVSYLTLTQWASRETMPRIRTTLNLCWVFGISLLEFLHRKLPQAHSGSLRESIDGGVRKIAPSVRRPVEKEQMYQKLKTIVYENKFATLPFTEICRRKLQRREVVVRDLFPDLARMVSRRFMENRKLLGELKRERFCSDIKATARFLHSRGIVPNHKTLSQHLDSPGRLRTGFAVAALNEVRAELGYGCAEEQLLLAVGW